MVHESMIMPELRFDQIEPGDYLEVRSQQGAAVKVSKSSGPAVRRTTSVRRHSSGWEEPSPRRKPDAVLLLERILSEEYHTPVTVTKIQELSRTRKEVREVFFLRNEILSKVWAFKAEPSQTQRELATYFVIHKQGIPTGRPIGYVPSTTGGDYPFEVAILGGIVENAGEPYIDLLRHLELTPTHMFGTAQKIIRMIHEYHQKLTAAQHEFERYGIPLAPAGPRKEIIERFAAGLQLEPPTVEGLIVGCEQLYQRQRGSKVISHGDLHLGNIVTQLAGQDTTLSRFGIVDWGSLSLDFQESDIMDFWVHYLREAGKICADAASGASYLYAGGGAEKACSGREEGGDLFVSTAAERNSNAAIQGALRNIYEMYDPARKDPQEIKEKAQLHRVAAQSYLNQLREQGPESMLIVDHIESELSKLAPLPWQA